MITDRNKLGVHFLGFPNYNNSPAPIEFCGERVYYQCSPQRQYKEAAKSCLLPVSFLYKSSHTNKLLKNSRFLFYHYRIWNFGNVFRSKFFFTRGKINCQLSTDSAPVTGNCVSFILSCAWTSARETSSRTFLENYAVFCKTAYCPYDVRSAPKAQYWKSVTKLYLKLIIKHLQVFSSPFSRSCWFVQKVKAGERGPASAVWYKKAIHVFEI